MPGTQQKGVLQTRLIDNLIDKTRGKNIRLTHPSQAGSALVSGQPARLNGPILKPAFYSTALSDSTI
ncbi:hypothetical protein IM774_07645 [Erysipelotrichaceae bacterium RD49]|nr:hypothetical protein [Erysipelotrichaceae bacterium RD49]